jgi:hypothetical protein
MPDYSRYGQMANAFLSGPNAEAGSEWRQQHPRIDQFLTANPNFNLSQLGQGGLGNLLSQFGGGRPGGFSLGGGFGGNAGGQGGNMGLSGPNNPTPGRPMTPGGYAMGGPRPGGMGGGPMPTQLPAMPTPRPMPPQGGGMSPGIMPPGMGSPMPGAGPRPSIPGVPAFNNPTPPRPMNPGGIAPPSLPPRPRY